MKIRNLILPAISLGGLIFAGVTVRNTLQKPPETPPAILPATSPFPHALAGSGIVEPSSQLMSVATEVAGVASVVAVDPGARVKRGDVLFRIDDRARRAERDVKQAAVDQAQAKLERLRLAPRPEDIVPLEAALHEGEQLLADDKDKLRRMTELMATDAVVERDATAAKYAVAARTAHLAQTRAQLDLMKAGTWKPDLVVAEAEVKAARSAVQAVETDLDRLIVRAPVDGFILQVNVRVSEFVATGESPSPIVMGASEPFFVRVDLDENDASRFVPGSPGKAFLRGHQDAAHAILLEYVRVDPYVIPKRALTGTSFERVDTRVLQLLYRVASPPKDILLYCGQQVDVYVEDTAALRAAAAAAAATRTGGGSSAPAPTSR